MAFGKESRIKMPDFKEVGLVLLEKYPGQQ